MIETHPVIELSPQAIYALDLLEQAGFEAWCVGGCVRDAYLGVPVHDIDIATEALWTETRQVFDQAGCPTFETGTKHGTLTVKVDDELFEITTYRTDGTYGDARHPDTVEFVTDIREDLARRDFTINAMAYHPRRGLLDPFEGAADIEARTIRAVGNAETRFTEDALRILRGLRFASRLGFTLEPATAQGMRTCADKLNNIAVERVAVELEGLLLGSHVHDVIMDYCDILETVLPELTPMKGLDQKTPYHIYDVLEHTAYVVANTPPYPLARWTALFHDMGKPATFFTDENGIGHFYGHPAVSVEIAHTIMRRLKMSPKFAHDVELLVKYHDTQVEPTPKAVKRMLGKLGGSPDLFATLCDIKRADALSQAPHCRPRVELADQLQRVLDGIMADNAAFRLRDLAIKGSDVIACGVAPGPAVGALLNEALDAVIDERIPNNHDALTEFVVSRL